MYLYLTNYYNIQVLTLQRPKRNLQTGEKGDSKVMMAINNLCVNI